MENIKVVLMPNTVAVDTMKTIDDFKEAQDEMNEPMVMILDTKTTKVIKHFNVTAKNMDDLRKQYALKLFSTPDLPAETYEKFGNAYFIGDGPEEEIECDLSAIDSIQSIEKIAVRRLQSIEKACDIYESPGCKEVREAFSQQYELLKQCLHNEEHLKMLLEFDTQAYYMTAMYGDSMFTQGFYEGIKFMQQALEAGLKKVDETKKSHSAGNIVTFSN